MPRMLATRSSSPCLAACRWGVPDDASPTVIAQSVSCTVRVQWDERGSNAPHAERFIATTCKRLFSGCFSPPRQYLPDHDAPVRSSSMSGENHLEGPSFRAVAALLLACATGVCVNTASAATPSGAIVYSHRLVNADGTLGSSSLSLTSPSGAT